MTLAINTHCSSPATRQRGLTLIELLIALSVFAILGTLSYRGTITLLGGNERIEQELLRWQAINRALRIIENELIQIAVPLVADDDASPLPTLIWTHTPDAHTLSFLSLSPGDSLEQVGFRFEAGQLEWTRQTSASVAPERDILLDRIEGVTWRFLSTGGWQTNWPLPTLTSAPNPSSPLLPAAIELSLTLETIGTVTRVYALR